jgi:dTMP kinase
VAGRLIVLEGGEGTGKSTQAVRLAARIGAVSTREPGGTLTGERIRSVFLDPSLAGIDRRTETLLLLAARAQLVAELIRPALESGRDVVCDRYSGSTLAYQGYGRGLDVTHLAELSGWASDGLEPDRVLVLRVSAEVARARLAQRGGADRIEAAGDEFFQRVTAGFDRLAAERPTWTVVDGEGTIAEVAERIDAALR